ncbi:unnamed protein product [Aphanomyces euteiches]
MFKRFYSSQLQGVQGLKKNQWIPSFPKKCTQDKMDFPTFFAGLRDVRRGLHTRPERSFEEYKTQAFLREYLIKEAQIPAKNIRGVAKTGTKDR